MADKAYEEKKRLSVDLLLNLHCEIKKRAAARNVTMAQWIIMAINEQIKEEMKYE